jgi:hypothetical protein
MAAILLSDSFADLIVSATDSNSEYKIYCEDDLTLLRAAVDSKTITTKGLKLLSLFLKKENKGRRLQEFMSDSKKILHFPDFVVPPKIVMNI